MTWTNAFELLCYAITLLLLADIAKRKRWNELWLFVSAALAGFALELLAVHVTDIYHYITTFYLSVGFQPYQFPLFGGLMWGGLTVCALRVAKRLGLPPFVTALVCGWLIVTMDLFLDVAAIRLDGGFWVWDGRPITLDVTHHMFMSVIWVNFLGYMFETPAMAYLFLHTAEQRTCQPVRRQLLASVGIGVAGVAFVGVASGLSLALNVVTNEWFACVAFVLAWLVVLAVIVRAVVRNGLRLQPPTQWDVPTLVYWLAMYGFCVTALAHLGMASAAPAYFAACIVLGVGTLMLGMATSRQR